MRVRPITIVQEQKELATFHADTNSITISGRFSVIDKKIQEFVILSLEELVRQSTVKCNTETRFRADEYAIRTLLKRYPDVPLSYYVREIGALFAHEKENTTDGEKRLLKIKSFV